MTYRLVEAGEFMARRNGSVNPAKFPYEEFELHSIPAFDAGQPELLRGSEIGSSKQVVQPGDVMISKIVPHIRRSSVVGSASGRRQIASGEWIVFRNKSLFPHYLRHLLVSDEFNAKFMSTVSGVGGSLLRARPAEVAKIKIPVPPLSEQRRIAAILDKADALRAKRREAIAKLDQLLQSVFLDMFGDPATNPKGWPEKTFGELFDIGSSKRVLESQWRNRGIPFYRAREIVKLARDGEVDNDLFISEDLFDELSKKSGAPQPDDLMISAVGTLGACYLVRPGDRFYFKDASVLRFVPREDTVSEFVRFAFSTNHVLSQIHSGSGSTVGTYTISRAKETRLYAPPLVMQQKFAATVEKIEVRKRQMQDSAAKLHTLFASLQHRAFTGTL